MVNNYKSGNQNSDTVCVLLPTLQLILLSSTLICCGLINKSKIAALSQQFHFFIFGDSSVQIYFFILEKSLLVFCHCVRSLFCRLNTYNTWLMLHLLLHNNYKRKCLLSAWCFGASLLYMFVLCSLPRPSHFTRDAACFQQGKLPADEADMMNGRIVPRRTLRSPVRLRLL